MNRKCSRCEKLFDVMSGRMLQAERYGVEVLLAASSLWAASRLLTPPNNFVLYASNYAMAERLQASELLWGLLAAASCLLEIAGLLVGAFRIAQPIGLALRCFGLVLGGFFWSVIGWSFFMGNPNTIAGLPFALMGASAWWTLLRFPTIPGRGGTR